MDSDVEPVLLDKLPYLASALLKLFMGGDVVEERGTEELDVLSREASVRHISTCLSPVEKKTPRKKKQKNSPQRKPRHRPRRIPETNHTPLPLHRRQTTIKRRLPHAIKHRRYPLTPRNLKHLLGKLLPILLMILHHNLGPILPRKLPLLLRARRRDGPRPHRLQQLTQPESDAARRSGNEDPVALLHGVRVADERDGREGLQERRGGRLRVDGVRDRDGRFGVYRRVLCVRGGAHVGDAGAELEVRGDVGAQRGDGAGAFAAEDVGRVREGVDACAEVSALCVSALACRGGLGRIARVDVVDADELVLDEDLSVFDLRHGDVLLVL